MFRYISLVVLQVIRTEALYWKTDTPEVFSSKCFPTFITYDTDVDTKSMHVYGLPILEYPGLIKVSDMYTSTNILNGGVPDLFGSFGNPILRIRWLCLYLLYILCHCVLGTIAPMYIVFVLMRLLGPQNHAFLLEFSKWSSSHNALTRTITL